MIVYALLGLWWKHWPAPKSVLGTRWRTFFHPCPPSCIAMGSFICPFSGHVNNPSPESVRSDPASDHFGIPCVQTSSTSRGYKTGPLLGHRAGLLPSLHLRTLWHLCWAEPSGLVGLWVPSCPVPPTGVAGESKHSHEVMSWWTFVACLPTSLLLLPIPLGPQI